jgi:hypothetical protein
MNKELEEAHKLLSDTVVKTMGTAAFASAFSVALLMSLLRNKTIDLELALSILGDAETIMNLVFKSEEVKDEGRYFVEAVKDSIIKNDFVSLDDLIRFLNTRY